MKKTRRSFIFAIISLVLCFAMITSTTYAWFTDNQTVKNNKIKAGTLDVDLLMDSMVDGVYSGTYTSVANNTDPVFGYDKWEPGYSDAKKFKVVNKGNLALKYTFDFVITESFTGVENEERDNGSNTDLYRHLVEKNANSHLEEILRVYVSGSDVGTLQDVLNDNSILMQGNNNVLLPNSTTDFGEIKIVMPTVATNIYQNASLSFDIRLVATQFTYEYDGFGSNQYDLDAKLPLSAAATIGITEEVDSDKDLIASGKIEGASLAMNAINSIFNKMKDTATDVASNDLLLRVNLVENDIINDNNLNKVKVDLDISMSGKMTTTKNNNNTKVVNEVDIATLDDYAIIDYNLGTFKTGVSVLHNGNAMTELSSVNDIPGANGGFIYNQTTGILKIKVKSFSPFIVYYDFDAVPTTTDVVLNKNQNKYYSSVETAFMSASDGDSLVLITNTSLDSKVTIANKSINFDLGTYEIDCANVLSNTDVSFFVSNNGYLHILGNGKIYNCFDCVLVNGEDAECVIDNGTFLAYHVAVYVGQNNINGEGTLLIKDGYFKSADTTTNYTWYVLGASGANVNVTILDGTFECLANSNSYGHYGIAAFYGAKLVLGDSKTHTGPSVTSNFACIATNGNQSPYDITINGGTYTAGPNGCKAGFTHDDFSVLLINSAASSNPSDISKLTINGGTFTETFDDSNPSSQDGHILVVRYTGTKIITINDGAFNTTGSFVCWRKKSDSDDSKLTTTLTNNTSVVITESTY